MKTWNVEAYSGLDSNDEGIDEIYQMSPAEILQKAKDLEGRGKKRDASRLYAHLGRRYLTLNKEKTASDVLSHAVSLNSRNGEAYFLLGIMALAEDDLYGADHYFRRAIRIRPDSVEHRIELGVVLYTLRKWDEAEKVLRESLTLKRTPRGLQFLGLTLSECGKDREALEFLREAHLLSPEEKDIMFSLGVTLFRGGERDEACALLQRSVEHPKHQRKKVQLRIRDALDIGEKRVESWKCLADIFSSIERTWEETIALEVATRIAPKDAEAWYLLSEAHMNYDLHEQAVVTAWMLNPQDPDILCANAELFYDAGMEKEALDTFYEVIVLDPEHSEALGWIEKIEEDFEELEAAGECPRLGDYGGYYDPYDDYFDSPDDTY